MGYIFLMRRPRVGAGSLVLGLFLAISACRTVACDERGAIELARQEASKLGPLEHHTGLKIVDLGETWFVDIFDPDAAIGGHIEFEIAKDRCVVEKMVPHQ